MMNPKLNPDQWYDGTVGYVHPNYRWLEIQETVTGNNQIFLAQSAYNAVVLEVTLVDKKDVKFRLDLDMKVKEMERGGVTVRIG